MLPVKLTLKKFAQTGFALRPDTKFRMVAIVILIAAGIIGQSGAALSEQATFTPDEKDRIVETTRDSCVKHASQDAQTMQHANTSEVYSYCDCIGRHTAELSVDELQAAVMDPNQRAAILLKVSGACRLSIQR